jgi:hypothetical protein
MGTSRRHSIAYAKDNDSDVIIQSDGATTLRTKFSEWIFDINPLNPEQKRREKIGKTNHSDSVLRHCVEVVSGLSRVH